MIRAELARGTGIVKTARLVGTGVSAVQCVKAAMALRSAPGVSCEAVPRTLPYRLTPKSWPTRAGRLNADAPRAMSSNSRPKNGMT